MKDAGGGTYGPGETSSTRSMRLNHLLREMARKYDQYDEYMQQDAHELLRHLLDSMEMEEKDVIKKVQPQPLHSKKNAVQKDGISPMASPLASPAHSAPPSPTPETFAVPAALPAVSHKGAGQNFANSSVHLEEPREVPEEERLVPFVDVLFGGLLASVVVCEHCKTVREVVEYLYPELIK